MAGVPISLLYTVSTHEFTVAGKRYDMSGLTMNLAMNQVPSCTVMIAPDGSGARADIQALELSKLKDAFDELSEQATKLAESNLTLVLNMKGLGGSIGTTQRLVLKNWVLVGVSLENVNTKSPFSLSCTICHPAYRLAVSAGPLFSGDYGADKIEKDAPGVSDVVDAGKRALDAMIEANSSDNLVIPKGDAGGTNTEMKTEEQVINDIVSCLQKSRSNMDEYLLWDSSFANASDKIPFDSAGGMPDAMRYAVCSAWMGSGGVKNVWSSMEAVLGQFDAWVVPTYDKDKLTVCPMNPWIAPKLNFPDKFAEVLSFPSPDPAPLYGTALYMGEEEKTVYGTDTYQSGAASGNETAKTNLSFIPKSADASIGTLKVMSSPPPWVSDAIYYATQHKQYPGGDEVAPGNSWAEPKPDAVATGEIEDVVHMRDCLATWLANMFMIHYREKVQASMRCPFIPVMDGKPFIPGGRIKFISGKALFTGFVSQVRHSIDMPTGYGTTSVLLSHCLSGDALGDEIIGMSPCCPMYQATA